MNGGGARIDQKSLLPSVSVVIPVYNGARTIRPCLKALQQLEYPKERVEVIVVDNNSNDGTLDIVSNYSVTLLHERDIQTSYAARNRGILHASGEIVAFVDADCIADSNWLRALVQPFAESTIAGVAGKVASYKPASLVEAFTVHADPLGNKSLGGLLSMITANVAYRRTVLMQVEGFGSDLFTGADVDLGWRIQQLPGCHVRYVPEAIVYHKHRTTFSGLRRQYHRYGYSEIILDTLYRNQTFYPRTPQKQLLIMLRQFKALVTYLLAFVYRLGRSILFGWDSEYVAWPMLWFVAESSNLLGKIQGLVSTRLFTQKPKSQRVQETM